MMKKLSIVLALFAFAILCIAHGEPKQTTNLIPVSLHSGPHGYSPIMSEIPALSTVEVLGENTHSGYIFVRIADGQTGWLEESHLQASTQKSQKPMTHNILDKIYFTSIDVGLQIVFSIDQAINFLLQVEPIHWFCLMLGFMILSCGILIGLLWSKKVHNYRLRWQ